MPPDEHRRSTDELEPLTPANATGNGKPSTADLIAVQCYIGGLIQQSEGRSRTAIDELKTELKDYRTEHKRDHETLKAWLDERLKPAAEAASVIGLVQTLWKNKRLIAGVIGIVFLGSGIADFVLDMLIKLHVLPSS